MDSELDLDPLSDILQGNPKLKTTAMSLAEKLKTEVRQEGRPEGELMGLIRYFENGLALPMTSREDLANLSLTQLSELKLQRQEEYEASLKN